MNTLMKSRHDQVRNVFRDIFEGWMPTGWVEERFNSGFNPLKDIIGFSPVVSDETETNVYYYLDMPGVRQQNLTVSLTDNTIRVQAERTGRIQSKIDTQFTVPSYVRLDTLTAELVDGILSISFERVKPVENRKSEPRRIEVKTSTTQSR